jgi:hypothetical protein
MENLRYASSLHYSKGLFGLTYLNLSIGIYTCEIIRKIMKITYDVSITVSFYFYKLSMRQFM